MIIWLVGGEGGGLRGWGTCLFECPQSDDGARQGGEPVGVQKQSPEPGQTADGLG